jgi:secreted trypsin-like serine protease
MRSQLILPIFALLAASAHASHHQFPFAVALFSGRTRCSGSLISRRAILTVSECLTESTTEVVLGANDLTDSSEPSQVRFTVSESSYIRDPNSLLAVIRFEPQIAFLTDFINLVQQPFSTPGDMFSDVSGTHLGFLNSTAMPDTLRPFSVRTIRNQDCTRAHPSITSEQICISNTVGCTLGLGSPIVASSGGRLQQIAIQFSRNTCGGGNSARSIFLRITPFLTFIRTSM